MSEQENALELTDDRNGNRLAWFLTGVAIGAAAAVLYAPRSGRDTREFISRKSHEGREAVESASQDIIGRSRDLFERGRQLVEDAADLFERGRKLVQG